MGQCPPQPSLNPGGIVVEFIGLFFGDVVLRNSLDYLHDIIERSEVIVVPWHYKLIPKQKNYLVNTECRTNGHEGFSFSYLSFCEALGYCKSTSVGLSPPPNALLKLLALRPDVISAAWTIGNGFAPSSENAFSERTRLSGSPSALSSVLARLRTSNDVSVSLASSSLLSRSSGVCRFRFRNGVACRDFDARCSALLFLEVDLLSESRVLLPFA